MCWDSGEKFIYRIGDEGAYDLRVSSAHYIIKIRILYSFSCLASFIHLLFELTNLFYYLTSVLSAPFYLLYFYFKILDNSAVGVKHPGVECRGCGQKDIAGMRWECLDCPTPIDLCTFCFTNGKYDQRYVYFRRYHHPSSDPYIIIYFILIIS